MFRKLVVPMVLVFTVTALMLFVAGVPVPNLVDLPTILPVVILPFILASFGFGLRRSKLAFSAPFSAGSNIADQRSSIAYFNAVLSYAAGFTVLLLGLGMIGIVTHLSSLDNKVLGMNIAVALISIFTGAFAALLLILPFRTAAVSRLAELEGE